MLTDAPLRKANRTRFLESDRTLYLPQDERLASSAASTESAMKCEQASSGTQTGNS
jgi:hypothetical protein